VRALLAPELAEAVDACDPPAELRARVRPDQLPEDERVCALEFRQYLQMQLLLDTDAMAMRHSLEVRTPLVDRDLLRAAARVPAALRRAGPAKRALRDAPRPPVPPALWQRRKQGFTLPFERWLRTGAIALEVPEHPWLRGAVVQRVLDDFRRGRVHWSRVWALLVLREFLNGSLRSPC
jgi:asparagine synthase (glutamine-hydrolysing)